MFTNIKYSMSHCRLSLLDIASCVFYFFFLVCNLRSSAWIPIVYNDIQ